MDPNDHPTNFKITHASQQVARRIRFTSPPSYSVLISKLNQLWPLPTGHRMVLSYVDTTGDRVVLSSDGELEELYQDLRNAGEATEVVKFRLSLEQMDGETKDGLDSAAGVGAGEWIEVESSKSGDAPAYSEVTDGYAMDAVDGAVDHPATAQTATASDAAVAHYSTSAPLIDVASNEANEANESSGNVNEKDVQMESEPAPADAEDPPEVFPEDPFADNQNNTQNSTRTSSNATVPSLIADLQQLFHTLQSSQPALASIIQRATAGEYASELRDDGARVLAGLNTLVNERLGDLQNFGINIGVNAATSAAAFASATADAARAAAAAGEERRRQRGDGFGGRGGFRGGRGGMGRGGGHFHHFGGHHGHFPHHPHPPPPAPAPAPPPADGEEFDPSQHPHRPPPPPPPPSGNFPPFMPGAFPDGASPDFGRHFGGRHAHSHRHRFGPWGPLFEGGSGSPRHHHHERKHGGRRTHKPIVTADGVEVVPTSSSSSSSSSDSDSSMDEKQMERKMMKMEKKMERLSRKMEKKAEKVERRLEKDFEEKATLSDEKAAEEEKGRRGRDGRHAHHAHHHHHHDPHAHSHSHSHSHRGFGGHNSHGRHPWSQFAPPAGPPPGFSSPGPAHAHAPALPMPSMPPMPPRGAFLGRNPAALDVAVVNSIQQTFYQRLTEMGFTPSYTNASIYHAAREVATHPEAEREAQQDRLFSQLLEEFVNEQQH